ncbi:MAG: 1-acyl-sn-glycerol-3-phosphate acyltransferase [Burkholderiaceae bacterium]|nr:1-acyl-sn-glycerol-3-phosphate acyltransferase [Burkholderiaceae bacterium]
MNLASRAWTALCSAVYLLFLVMTVIPYALAVIAWSWRPQDERYWLATGWCKIAIWGARWICGIRWRIEGRENLPAGPAVLLPKHQSAWDTLWLPATMPRKLTFVYKRELHRVPFFGWAFATLGMINIDRSKGQTAFEQVLEQGTAHLRDGWWIVIFPEGTRTPPGSNKRYKTGGVRLAVRTDMPVVPIALNSGECWPRKAFLKRPGEVTVSIGAPIPIAGRTDREIAPLVEAWIETEMRRLAPHRYSGPYEAVPPPESESD